ncbi:MBL fold metallo-hydrolase [Paenibacillus sp. VCA1]|uniref:MBL fold metallo-hydrolase n=1 Tax=Paenibacillus sp. VCA1 TaxID=3039148 RepID=UPI00287161CE|nr:MBL fold metallo-hydrolase [Paenibacillus sp. VCA1]MDR9856176.1 MBL fold metallo-hydrolase [Paenibacillus sp. VCA1]
MKLGQQIVSVELYNQPGAAEPAYQPVLLWDDKHGATLVDTGMMGQMEQMEKAVREAGLRLSDIQRIILTHQDVDHVGNLPALIAANPNIEVWAHADDIPYITGEKRIIKMTDERIVQMPEAAQSAIRALFEKLPSIRISRVLEDGEMLDIHGGMRVIHTPGHTPGHVCLYLPEEKLLLAADELRVVDGDLAGPPEGFFTPDMKEAIRSMHKLTDLTLNGIFCYHGGLYDRNPSARLAELLKTLEETED